MRNPAGWTGFIGVCLFALLVYSCQTPDAMAKFAQQAADDIAKGPAVFNDLTASCERRTVGNAALRPAWETTDAPAAVSPQCSEFSTQSRPVLADSDALRNYFQALKEVASFGSAGEKSARGGAGGGPKNPPALAENLADASSLAQLTGKLVGERYQRKHLKQIVQQADPDVAAITTALQQIARKQYGDELRLEQEDLTDRFIAFQKKGDADNPAILYSLNYIYRREISDIDQRRASANAYMDALAKVRAGHHELASGNDKLGLKELEAAADRYSAELEQLGNIISKKF